MSENNRPPRDRQPENPRRAQPQNDAPQARRPQEGVRRPAASARPAEGQRPGEGSRPAGNGRPSDAARRASASSGQAQRRPAGTQRPAETRRPVQGRPAQGRPSQQTRRRAPVDPALADEYSFLRKAEARKTRRKRQRIVLLAAAALLVVAIFAIKMAFDLGAGATNFYEGITVDGVKLSPYTMEEAKAQLQMTNADRINGMTVHLQYDTREWSISPEQLGVSLNIDEVLEQAWALGHEGNIFARQRTINRLKRDGEAFRTELSYDENYLRQQLQAIKESVDTDPVDATVTFDPDKEEQFRITPEQNGRSVDVEALYEQVSRQLENGFTSMVEIKPDVVTPTVYAETLQESTSRLVRVSTDLGNSSDARIHNVKTALSFFNGLVVQPGQEVSFNQTTGERGLEQGYQNAGVIQDDEIVDGPGGGVCQVSTTLYHAVVKAGLEIIRSNKHSMPVSYVDVGTDAAVAWDYKDLIFKNNTDHPIFIEGKVSGKTVVVSVYGYPLEEGLSYDIVSEVYETIPAPPAEVVLDTTGEHATYTDELVEGKKSRQGTKVRSYRVTKRNGEEVSRELLRDDYYKEVTGVTYQGVTPRAPGDEGGANGGNGGDNGDNKPDSGGDDE